MSHTWALIPAKSPERAKTRLGDIMLPEEAAEFSLAMLRDMLTALKSCEQIDNVAVITDDDAVTELAAEFSYQSIHDNSDDLCSALHHGVSVILEQQARTVLVMPGDMPTITGADIDNLLSKHTDGLSLCPAIRDGGTNALVCTPPDAVEFCFGHDSARRHLSAAETRGLAARRLALPAFFRDIDLPDDLVWLNSQLNDEATGANSLAFLRQSGISARLGPANLSVSA